MDLTNKEEPKPTEALTFAVFGGLTLAPHARKPSRHSPFEGKFRYLHEADDILVVEHLMIPTRAEFSHDVRGLVQSGLPVV